MTESERSDISAVHDFWKDVDFEKGDGLASHEREVFPVLRRRIGNRDRVLEIGTGNGRWIDALRQSGVDADFYGIDITDQLLSADCIRVFGDTRSLPFVSDCFDCTYSIGVIEHFPESKTAIAEHARVTVPNGWIFLITPHLSPRTLRRYVEFYNRGEHKRGSFEAIRGRNLTRYRLSEYLSAAGLADIETGCYGDTYLPVLGTFDSVQQVLRSVIAVAGSFVYAVGRVPDNRA